MKLTILFLTIFLFATVASAAITKVVYTQEEDRGCLTIKAAYYDGDILVSEEQYLIADNPNKDTELLRIVGIESKRLAVKPVVPIIKVLVVTTKTINIGVVK